MKETGTNITNPKDLEASDTFGGQFKNMDTKGVIMKCPESLEKGT